MTLPRRKPEKPKRETRWRSPAHCHFVRLFRCCMCGSATNVVAAHVRLGTHTGIGQKPDDWRTVPLCDGPHSGAGGLRGCHDVQHGVGEETFWAQYADENGQTVDQLLASLCAASPKSAEIAKAKRERAVV